MKDTPESGKKMPSRLIAARSAVRAQDEMAKRVASFLDNSGNCNSMLAGWEDIKLRTNVRSQVKEYFGAGGAKL